jgi:hypothetical protein
MAIIKFDGITEGEILNKYFRSRLMENNKNVLVATTGQTGSGKSYADLRIAESWYHYNFNEEFPIRNVCFSIEEVTNLLHEGKLRRGEIIILEEGGVNLGSLDFQSKMSKMFSYILQSFRSMNLCLIINLPYLSMLNKSARMLIHLHLITSGINFETKVCELKPLFLQVAQGTGKIYTHYPKAKMNNRVRKIERFCYSLPSVELSKAYEKKKEDFLKGLIKSNVEKMNPISMKSKPVTEYKWVTGYYPEVKKLMDLGLNQIEIGKKLNISRQRVGQIVQAWGIRDFQIKNGIIPRELPICNVLPTT